jgi:hypothetical protein
MDNDNQNPEWIPKRNERLNRFWRNLGLPVRLIGKPNSPAMIFDDRWLLSCYVANFNLNFLDKNDNGNIIMSVKLTETPVFSPSAIVTWLGEANHKPIYRIMVTASKPQLYLSGYNFLDSANNEGRFPVFANRNPKIYFTEQSAKEKAGILINEGYDLLVIKPSSNMINLKKYA